MKKNKEKISKKALENNRQKFFYKTNPSGGISLIVLVITIIVVIILAAAVIISLQNNNPMVEANKARINSDVANMQAIFTNTVGKIMAENQDVVEIKKGQLNVVTSGVKKTDGVAKYEIKGTDGNVVVRGSIMFKAGNKEGTTYYTGKELPLYGSETKWYVDEQGLVSVEVGGVLYGEGSKSDNPPVEEGEEIVPSDNPVLQSWKNVSTDDFHSTEYKSKITKVKFAVNVKVPKNKIEAWDVSEAKDGSVMSWVIDDGNEGYILTIAGKEKIIANANSGFLFYKFENLKEIEGLELLDTSKAINMESMFRSCENLITLDLNKFDTSSVTNMEAMFYYCHKLTSINLDRFDTKKVNNMREMFYYCFELSDIDISSFNTSEVKDMQSMFNSCRSLTNIVLSNFDTSKITSMYHMFYGCSKLTSIDLSNFNTTNVTNMRSMFVNCINLKSINFGDSFDISKVTDLSYMFSSCKNLVTVFNVNGNVSNYEKMFMDAAINPDAKITVNYTAQTSSLVDQMIATKSASSNVVKGVQID